MNRTAKDNAHEFGQITKQGYGVHLALLAACSVGATSSKLPVTAFAKEAGVSHSTVTEYLSKWDRMSDGGWNVARSMLLPDDVDTLELSDDFIAEFDALQVTHGSKVGLTGMAANVAKNKDAMRQAILADPKVAKAAFDAVSDSAHRGVTGVSDVNRPPTTSPGRAQREQWAGEINADEALTEPILEAHRLLKGAKRVWSKHEGQLDKSHRPEVQKALNEILIVVESLRLEMGLSEEAVTA